MKRLTRQQESAAVLLLLMVLAPSLPAAEDAALVHARKLLAKHPLIDGHNDLPWAIREYEKAPRDVVAYDLRQHTPGQTDFERLKAGGVGGQFWSVFVPAEEPSIGYAKTQLEQIDIARRVIARYPDRLQLATTADDVERARKHGRIAHLRGMEGGHVLENSLGALRAYYDLGARYLTLTHGTTLDWADAAGDTPRHGGLTRFGEEVVREMNRLGMLVDLSHVTPETLEAALRVSQAPVIFSHSSARALCDHVRDVPDDVLKRLPGNGGIVMVTFVASFISDDLAKASAPLRAEAKARLAGVKDPAVRRQVNEEINARLPPIPVTIAQVADHVEHVVKVAGADHVGLGGDFDGNDRWPEGLEDVSTYPRLFAELIRRGWSDRDLRKLAQGNLLRVLRGAARAANRPACFQRQGHYPPPPGVSDIPGIEVAGEVVARGDGVDEWRVGDVVCALVAGGGYAEYCLAPAPQCLPVPKGLSEIEAAAMPETFFTVWTNVFERGRLGSGEALLVHGGASGIGTTAIQMARSFGARVFATAGSAEKCAACAALGAERAINYREQDFVAAVKEGTAGRGVEVILDMVGGDYIPRDLECLALEGRLVLIALQGGAKAELNFTSLLVRRLTITGSSLRPRTVEQKGAIARALREPVWPLVESGRLRPVIHARFPLAEAAAAHRLMESGAHIGKIVLVTGG